jgi:hypothetical protein
MSPWAVYLLGRGVSKPDTIDDPLGTDAELIFFIVLVESLGCLILERANLATSLVVCLL